MTNLNFKRHHKHILTLRWWQVIIFLLIQVAAVSQAQNKPRPTNTTEGIKFIDAHKFLLDGRGATIPAVGYNRIDTNLLSKIPAAVARLSKNTAGLQVDFVTNSQSITFRWTLADYGILPNMTPIAKNGLDLYAMDNNHWQYVAAVAASGRQTQQQAITHLDGKMRHYRLYLPLYSSLTTLFIGIDSLATIQSPVPTKQPKIVIYGTSITQGASASRPGLAYPSLLSRHLNASVYNMGFSGSGKMEPIMAEVIGHMPSDLYILDCVPNMSAELIYKRAIPFVQSLRKIKPSTPILFMESPVRETSYWNLALQKSVATQNEAIKQVFLQLQKEGMEHIYYQDSKDFTGHDHEATIDGTHLTDVGFKRLTKILEAKILEILPALKVQN